jgi:hypothetical protein
VCPAAPANITTASGLATGVAVGTSIITATSGSISGSTTLTNTAPLLRLSTIGTLPAAVKISAIDITVTLAPGVSLKSTITPPETNAGIVYASGVATFKSLLATNYTAPTGTLPGRVRIAVVDATGIGTGEFAIVNYIIAAGSNPITADFNVTNLTISDTSCSPIAGLMVDIR